MKKFTFYLLILSLIFSFQTNAQCASEGQLISKIIESLKHKDSFEYAKVFVPADSMAKMIVRKMPASSEGYQHAAMLLTNPDWINAQDSIVIKQCSEWFRKILKKGKKLGIHWEAIVQSRYELEVLGKTKDTLLETIAPERYVGYVSIQDQLTRKVYMFTLSDILKIDGKYYGGELNYIFETYSKDEMNLAIKAENLRIAKGLPDTTQTNDSTYAIEDDEVAKRKHVVARKYYTGYLDDETPISLYIRYIEGGCPEGVCQWEAIFKYGDDDYKIQKVSKTEEGKWLFEEEEAGYVLELSLKGAIYSGLYTATLDKIDYDAHLKEKAINKKKLASLDAIVEDYLER